ncbi:MAG: hypothetical protein ACRD36_10115, partial [Candidatus Acidiferrum sp.]
MAENSHPSLAPENTNPHRPRMPATPLTAITKIVREQVIIEDRIFLIDRPDESDRLLDNPEVRQAFAADEYMPYWA